MPKMRFSTRTHKKAIPSHSILVENHCYKITRVSIILQLLHSNKFGYATECRLIQKSMLALSRALLYEIYYMFSKTVCCIHTSDFLQHTL